MLLKKCWHYVSIYCHLIFQSSDYSCKLTAMKYLYAALKKRAEKIMKIIKSVHGDCFTRLLPSKIGISSILICRVTALNCLAVAKLIKLIKIYIV